MKKEKYIWLPIISIPIALIGMILSIFNATKLQGFGLIGCGIVLAVVGLVLNFKSKHILSLLALFISSIVLNISLFTYQMKYLINTTSSSYQNSFHSSYSSSDSANNDSLEYDDSLKVSEIKDHYSQSDTVPLGNETVKVNSITNTDKDYIAINVTITNISEEDIQYSNTNFEVATGESDSIMDGIYSALAADDLGETKFAYLSSGVIKAGESVTGDLLYDNSYSYSNTEAPKYLVISDSVQRKAAIKLEIGDK